MIKRILFVDLQNSVDSPIAEAWFNRHTGGAKASSCGLSPAEWIDAQAIQAMYQVGIEIGHRVPKRLDLQALDHVDLVVSMGIAVPVPEYVQRRVWKLHAPRPSSFEDVCRVRDDICRRVDLLIKEIERAERNDRFTDTQWKTAVANLHSM